MKPLIVIMGSVLLVGVLSAGEDTLQVSEYIVKTRNEQALQRFADDNQLQLGPLISYPNPSPQTLKRFGCYYIVNIPESLTESDIIKTIMNLPGVQLVEEVQPVEYEPVIHQPIRQTIFNMPDTFDDPYTPDDPLYLDQWGIRKTKVNWAWNVSKGDGVKIAILDTGVDMDHEDLVDNLDLEHAWDFMFDTSDVDDWMGHGTAVTGVSAAVIDNQKGMAGVAGNVTVLPIAFGLGEEGLLYALDNGACIISMSWGGSGLSPAFEEAINYAWENGAFLCAAAGNLDTNEIPYPALHERVMAVGAVDSMDRRSMWADSTMDTVGGSCYGPDVDIYAPGTDVLTTSNDGTYFYSGGTSLATPWLAGVAALIWGAHPEYSNQDIWDKLIESADTITIDKGEVLRVNAARALDAVPGVENNSTLERPDWEVSLVGNGIVLRYSNSLGGFHAAVFDASGRKVDEIDSAEPSGTIAWGEGMPQGIYFIREMSRGGASTQKVVLID